MVGTILALAVREQQAVIIRHHYSSRPPPPGGAVDSWGTPHGRRLVTRWLSLLDDRRNHRATVP